MFAPVHLQVRQFEVPLAATGISTYEWTLFVGLGRPDIGRGDTSHPSNILSERGKSGTRLQRGGSLLRVLIYSASVNRCICTFCAGITLTDLKSSEDTVCVYVVLGTHEHGWRRGYGVTVVAGCMAAAGREQNRKFINTAEIPLRWVDKTGARLCLFGPN